MDNQLQLFKDFEGTYNQITTIIEVRKGNAKIVLNNEQLIDRKSVV